MQMNGKTHRVGPSIIQTAKDFASEQQCHAYLEAARWPNGVRCLQCGNAGISKFTVKGKTRVVTNKRTGEQTVKTGPDRYMYQCLEKTCKYQFAATTGTIFSDTKLPLSIWMQAVALMCTAKKGISAKQMERTMGISYKTAWYLEHRIRKAMEEGFDGLLTGTVEADETYIGGRYDKRRKRAKYDKEPVFGIIERDGKARTFHMPKVTSESVNEKIRQHVSFWADALYTDQGVFYKRSAGNLRNHNHQKVDHSAKEWIRGDVHTGTIDGYWSLLKRGIIGSFHQVSIKHLSRYLAEFQFRWNNRFEQEIFAAVVVNLVSRGALRYKVLTGPEVPEQPVSGKADEEPF